MHGSKQEIMFAVVYVGHGGDADTNGTVAGALLYFLKKQ